MPFNINTWKTEGLKQGGARPSQFEVIINPPQPSNQDKRIRLFVQAASLPAWTVQPAIVHYFGRQVKYEGDRMVSDWQVSVINDEDFEVRNIMERWSNQLNTMVSNRLDPALFPLGYKTTAEVYQYSKKGGVIRAYRMDGLWPMEVGAIELAWQAQNQIEQFSVTFAMDTFEISQGNPNPPILSQLSDEGAAGGLTEVTPF